MITTDYIIRVPLITESVNSVFTSPPSFTHTTTSDDFALLLSSYLPSVTTFLVAVLGVCCRHSLRLRWPGPWTQPGHIWQFIRAPGHSIQIHKNRLLIRTVHRLYRGTSWCDLQDTIRPVMREGELARFPLSLLGHENHHSVTNPEFRWAPLLVIL